MLNGLDPQEFERVTSRTGAFKGVEVDLLHETLLSWRTSPGDPYTVLELRDGKTLAAFAIIAKVAGREATYDVRYLVVDRDYRSSGGGSRLLQMLDEDLLKRNSFAVIRYETSTIKVGNMGPNRFEEAGYKVVGHIPGYYGESDDYFYLMKTIYRNPPKFDTLRADPAPDPATDSPTA